MHRNGLIYRMLRTVDIYLFHLDGYVVDFRKLDFVYSDRKLFNRTGLIKSELSLIPLRDFQLKKIASKFGGWATITSSDFVPPKELYDALKRAGINEEEFDLIREYNSNPVAYMNDAVQST